MKRKHFKGMACRDGADAGAIVKRLAADAPEANHWAILTDRTHRVVKVLSSGSLDDLANRLGRTRLHARCFALVTTEKRGDGEEAVVAEWRLKRLAENSDSCFFAWVSVESAATPVEADHAAA